MEEKYNEFKLNLGPDVLEAYNFSMAQIKEKIIPEELNKIFPVTELSTSYKYTCTIRNSDFLESDKYKEFIELAKYHEQEYLKIVKSFEETGGFSYTAEYQKLNARFGKLLSSILTEFPYLEEAFNIKDSSINDDLVFRVGTGKKYIERQRKIRKYLASRLNFEKEFSFEFYYEPSSEHIYILEGENTVTLARIIQDEVNKEKHITNIGEITINPISDKIKVEIKQKAPIKEIEFSYVYPNGHREATDRAKAIEIMMAEKEQTKFTTTFKDGFSIANIEKIAEEESKKGYLSDVRHRGKSVIKWLKREVLKDFN
ncbi:hypothetical protein [Lactococcus lactis]|uniref:hypothetical protein n=1 Tax=Lactococcus lactis TaxID=1358 RepID=UPI003D2A25E6